MIIVMIQFTYLFACLLKAQRPIISNDINKHKKDVYHLESNHPTGEIIIEKIKYKYT
jgi:hypothetical protein